MIPPVSLGLRKVAAVGGFWLLQAAVVWVGIGAFFMLIDWKWRPESLVPRVRDAWLVPWYLGFCALQGIFLLPVRRPIPGARGASVKVSLGVAGLAIAALVVGIGMQAIDQVWLQMGEPVDQVRWIPIGVGVGVTSWAVATALLIAFCRRGPRESLLARVAAGLFLGTVVEIAAVIPIHVLVNKKTDCVCARGTFWSLVICGGVGTFVLGPMVLLPLLARRRRRWYDGRCEVCGHDLGGALTVERCPACGAGWRPRGPGP